MHTNGLCSFVLASQNAYSAVKCGTTLCLYCVCSCCMLLQQCPHHTPFRGIFPILCKARMKNSDLLLQASTIFCFFRCAVSAFLLVVPGNQDGVFWLQAGRSNGITAGVQLRPHGPLSKPMQYMQSKDLSQMSQEVAEHLSYAVAYSPMPSTSYAGGKLSTQHACKDASVLNLLCMQTLSELAIVASSEHAHILHLATERETCQTLYNSCQAGESMTSDTRFSSRYR